MSGSRPRRLKRGHDRGKVILLIGPQSAEPDEGYDRGDWDLDDKPRLALQGTQHRAGLSSSRRGEADGAIEDFKNVWPAPSARDFCDPI